MRFGTWLAVAGALCLAAPAHAQQLNPLLPSPMPAPAAPAPVVRPPLALLLDGLGVYVENDYVGVSALSRPLRRQGFRTASDTHFLNRYGGLVPDVVIGHSLGGSTALNFARDLVRRGYPAPLVITVDAAPGSSPCPVARCVNIRGPGFPDVRGAQNIDAWALGARFTTHATLPTHPAVQAAILERTSAYMVQRVAAQAARVPIAPARPGGG